jgi:hypothetical protein
MSTPSKVVLADGRLRDAIIRTNFSTFVQKVFETLSPSATYSHSWHIDAMCHQLERVRRGEIKRLIINVPPRSLKSTVCSIAFPAYLLGHNPAQRVICLSYGYDLAVKLGIDCRQVMNASWYRRIFPATEISRIKNTETEFTTLQYGYRISSSIEGSLTGRGGDIIVLDDPIKPIDALSDIKRERVNNAFFNTILSRLDDKQTGAIIVVMQRLHENDLVGRLLRDSPEKWTVLSLAAIAEQDEQIDVGQGKPHVRRRGDVLVPEREPRPIVELLRTQLGQVVFSAQYQQCPIPREGAMIKRSWIRRYDRLPERKSATMIQSWDTALKE